MAGLQRSSKSFRRQGSSGCVWEDKQLSHEINGLMGREGNADNRELRPCYSIGWIRRMMANIDKDKNVIASSSSVCCRSLSAPVTKPSSMVCESVGVSGNGKPPEKASKFSLKFGKKKNML